MSDLEGESAAKTVYKIFRTGEWSSAQGEGRFLGSPDDIRDGFIHFSTAEQLRGTLKKYFASEDEIVLAAIDVAKLGDNLKWEISRGGMRFPHLYAPLFLDAVTEAGRYTRDNSGDFILPPDIP